MEEEIVTEAENLVETVAAKSIPDTVVDTVTETTRSILHVDDFKKLITAENLIKAGTGILALIIFYIIYRFIKSFIKRRAVKKLEPHNAMLLNKVISYVFYVLMAMYVLGLIGVDLSAVWGAAGVAGLAIGFAAQTSVSNLISGIFVLSEKTMKVGDFISVGGESGVVDGIGLLSVKIHTLDNQMIRIPNSTIINSNLMNYNHFPLRRFVFEIPIGYETDLTKALETVRKVPALCPTVLEEPAPAVFYDGFKEAVVLKLAVWFKSCDLAQTKNDVYINVINLCKEAGVEIPYTYYNIRMLNK